MTCAPQIRNARQCSAWETDLVQFLVELVELSCLGHLVLVHEKGRLDLAVASFAEKVEAVGDKGLVKVDAIVREEEPSMACNLCTCDIRQSVFGRGARLR